MIDEETHAQKVHHSLAFNIQPAGTSGLVSMMVRLVPVPADTSNYDKTWDFQCAIKGTMDPMMARHIGRRLIEQADLAEVAAKREEEAKR